MTKSKTLDEPTSPKNSPRTLELKKKVTELSGASERTSKLSETFGMIIDKALNSLSTAHMNNLCVDAKTTLSLNTTDPIAQNIQSLRSEYVLRISRPIVQKLIFDPRNNGVFNIPVDPIALGIPNYFKIIQRPMDLGTILSNLREGKYKTVRECFADVELVFENAIVYNAPVHFIHKLAKDMLHEFLTELKSTSDKCLKENEKHQLHSCSLCSGAECNLCGEKCLTFEPPYLHCQQCGLRIKKNANFYICKDGSLLWCQKCYVSLPSVIIPAPKSDQEQLLHVNSTSASISSPLSTELATTTGSTVRFSSSSVLITGTATEESSAMLSSDEGDYVMVTEVDDDTQTACETSSQYSTLSTAEHATMYTHSSRPIGLPHPPCCVSETESIFTAAHEDYLAEEDSGLGPSSAVAGGGGPLLKRHLLKRRSDEEVAEPWVSCDSCGQWCHQICAQYNPHEYEEKQSVFHCHLCLLNAKSAKHAKPAGSPRSHSRAQASPTSLAELRKNHRASSLPRSKLSDFLEVLVRDMLCANGYEEAARSITIRLTANKDSTLDVPKCIVENMCNHDHSVVPLKLGYKQKCILLFQEIDGVDVCLFSLYVQEFDKSCPAPNTSTVYIAYLDSVDFFRPTSARTLVYQEIVAGYLKWTQARGFKQAHIWSCPPHRGDNFIFNTHPAHQKYPSRDRLNMWYKSIIQRCVKIGAVSDVDNLWQRYFAVYARRDVVPTNQRKAAKKSFVGSGKAARKAKYSHLDAVPHLNGGGLQGGCDLSVAPVVVPTLKPPVCPPIFEGDYWVQQYVYLINLHTQRGKTSVSSEAHKQQSCTKKLREVLKRLMSRHESEPFLLPVDHIALNIPLYPLVIKHPMDLSTVKEKLFANKYTTALEFAKDVRLIFANAKLFNPPGHYIHTCADVLLERLEKSLRLVVTELLESEPGLRLTLPSDLVAAFGGLSGRGSSSAGDADSEVVSDELLNLLRTVSADDKTNNSTSSSAPPAPTTPPASAASVLRAGSPSVTVTPTTKRKQLSVAFLPQERGNNENPLPVKQEMREDTLPPPPAIVDMEIVQDKPQKKRKHVEVISDFEQTDDETMHSGSDSQEDDLLSLSPEPVEEDSVACDVNASYVPRVFDAPVLGMEASLTIAAELSKRMQRHFDDLFVLQLADIESEKVVHDFTFGGEGSITSKVSVTEGMELSGDTVNKAHHKDYSLDPPVHVSKKSRSRGPAITTNSSGARRIPSTALQGGLMAFSGNEQCRSMLAALPGDTSDPDPSFESPLADSRHTFLEMCQFKHYQFDTLRRAKYSSLMLLYYLQNPYKESCRPRCAHCSKAVRNIRWHCDECPDFDLCQSCYDLNCAATTNCNHLSDPLTAGLGGCIGIAGDYSAFNSINTEHNTNGGKFHPHFLTPYRVTFR